MVRDIGRQFLQVVSHHNHGLIPSLAERLNDVPHQLAVPEVESVQGLVEYQQLRVFHESACQQH